MLDLRDLFLSLGFTQQHINLMLLCAAFSALGSFTQFLRSYWGNLAVLPTRPPITHSPSVVLKRLAWLLSRVIIGAVLGFLFGLYLTGALTEGVTVVARVLVFAALLGYSVPRISEKEDALTALVTATLGRGQQDLSKLLDSSPGRVPPNPGT